ncbi:MAG: M6 family metalloprotease domain-containing protein [Bacteroidales bacterium]|nr:M6 family metalloprotease domain-containing protein [Bacteroidales bacterium]MCM1146296.1 M6 family metalloprotease domain-containing protein [Bacteroidales bacterium]MCM1205266.1 M6 family metalloprotease domain-containing protein [Bacillota bacterium]MCM1509649.1 M6 family metalloprotease domain-containing protein [Clostridium sp.]
MIKKLISTLLLLSAMTAANAVPMYPRPVKLPQPDGTEITVVGHGDEYCSYITTLDGYSIVKGNDNYFRYAKLDGGKLMATDVIAHEPEMRSAKETAFLGSVTKHLVPEKSAGIMPLYGLEPAMAKSMGQNPMDNSPLPLARPDFNLKDFRGLLILANYKDCKFRMGDAGVKAVYEGLMNGENYTGYNDAAAGGFQSCTGSVRDYFSDNTYGAFTPQFDIVVVDVDYSMYDMNGTSNSINIAWAAARAADAQGVDFSKYDADNDGFVDMFYIVYAGHAASYSGNDSRLLHPHAFSFEYYNYSLDGKRLGRYACSTELYGWTVRNDNMIDGIGVICHEFSHVLGYSDHYDTTYSGYEQPDTWDVMSGGSYNGPYGRTPAGYNSYERLTGGFLAPVEISDMAGETLSLNSLETEAKAYRINSMQNKVFFLIENRQRTKWDVGLPGTGMLVWRVDSTSTYPWDANRVNSTARPYLRLVRANGWTKDMADSQADPFPGTRNVTVLSNTTSPANLLTYDGYKSPAEIHNIVELNKTIYFKVVDPDAGRVIPEGALFYESFDDCMGTGGNDGIFGPAMSASTFFSDNEGWTTTKPFGAASCAFFGSATQNGAAITPALELEDGKAYTLSFKVAPYDGDGTALAVAVTSGNAMISDDASAGNTPANSVTINMENGKWNEYSLTLTCSGSAKLRFRGAIGPVKRFFLDEVLLKEKVSTGITEIVSVSSPAYNDNASYNLSGQRVGDGYRGIKIINGRKIK